MKTPDVVSAAARWFSLHWLAVVGWAELIGGPSEVTFEIGVNLFALLAVYLLVRHRDDAGGTARPSAGEAIDAPSA